MRGAGRPCLRAAALLPDYSMFPRGWQGIRPKSRAGGKKCAGRAQKSRSGRSDGRSVVQPVQGIGVGVGDAVFDAVLLRVGIPPDGGGEVGAACECVLADSGDSVMFSVHMRLLLIYCEGPLQKEDCPNTAFFAHKPALANSSHKAE